MPHAMEIARETQFADLNIGQEAVSIANGGPPLPVRVVARRADAVTDFGDARLWSETTRIDLRLAEGRLNTKGRAFGRLTRPRRGHGPASPSRSKTGRGVVTAPIFLLVPQVKLPKRLDLARDAERAHDAVPGLIVANWVEGWQP